MADMVEKMVPVRTYAYNYVHTSDSITIIQNFTVGDVATQTTVQQAVAGSERRMVEAIERRQKYGGGR